MKINLKELRTQFLKENGYICPIFKKKYSEADFVIDHDHETTYIRGAIHKNANQIEGKIRSAFVRFGGTKEIDLASFLRNLADYLETNKSTLKLVHPSEIKTKLLKKSSYNKLKSICKKQNINFKIEYPKSRKLTIPLAKIFKKMQLAPEYYKN